MLHAVFFGGGGAGGLTVGEEGGEGKRCGRGRQLLGDVAPGREFGCRWRPRPQREKTEKKMG